MKKILVVTGTRADYGIYVPVLKRIEKSPFLDLQLLVTGMHLSAQYGNTVDYIQRDGFSIAGKVECLMQGDSHGNMARSIGLAILGMTSIMEEVEPDFVIVLGDRGEMLAAAIVASHLNILLVHLHGGEVSGTIDESVRHAITKLSHLHLPATEQSGRRLIALGEDFWRVEVVGAPRIETILTETLPKIEEVKAKYGLTQIGRYLLFVYHPVTTEDTAIEELRAMLEVLAEQQEDVICILPNSDAGTHKILEIYREFKSYTSLHWVQSFEQLDYLTVLRHCEALIGNSSSGIIEAASFRIPVINIGSRQQQRERSGNVIDIPESAGALKSTLEYAFSESFQKELQNVENKYEKEGTSERIVSKLESITDPSAWTSKTIAY